MTLRLPETFSLPDGETYDRLIDELDQEIQQEGSASLYLGMVREKRRDSEVLNKTLRNQALIGLVMEERYENGLIVDRAHKLANTALSGMLFGHFLNERHYPHMGFGIYPYDVARIEISSLGEYASRYHELGGSQTLEGMRLGFSAMAATQLNRFSEQSVQKVHTWAEETIYDPSMRGNFISGIGLSLFMAWHAYQEILVEQDASEYLYEDDELLQSNRGDD